MRARGLCPRPLLHRLVSNSRVAIIPTRRTPTPPHPLGSQITSLNGHDVKDHEEAVAIIDEAFESGEDLSLTFIPDGGANAPQTPRSSRMRIVDRRRLDRIAPTADAMLRQVL